MRTRPLPVFLWLSATLAAAWAQDGAPIVASVAVPGTGLAVKLATQVGLPYDARTIDKDVRYLWSLGRFDDVRVETASRDDGVGVTFRTAMTPHLFLREIRIQPTSYGLDLQVPTATPVTPLRAHQIALDAQRRLNRDGYRDARVHYILAPAAKGQVDLKLTIAIGEAVRVKEVRFEGDARFRRRLQALRTRRMLPGIPYLWSGWKLVPSYSREAVDADVARLHSLYVADGFFDATVRPGAVDVQGKDARVTIVAKPGPRYPLDPGLCAGLFTQRRESQRHGILDFSATLNAASLSDGPTIERGRPYRVGRIEFSGNHRYRDSTIRRNLLVEEGQTFDEHLLRKSIARLNRSGLFEGIDSRHVVVQPDETTGFADVTIHLKERKGGNWNLSGPVGPASLAGPIQASIGARLPSWGSGLLELSTYTVSLGISAFAQPILPFLNAPRRFIPILALNRPFTPGLGWKSGFLIAPQLGWRNGLVGYGTTQLQQRLLPLISGERGVVPDLSVTVARPEGDVAMSCEAPKPRLGPLRAVGTMAVHFMGIVTGF